MNDGCTNTQTYSTNNNKEINVEHVMRHYYFERVSNWSNTTATKLNNNAKKSALVLARVVHHQIWRRGQFQSKRS